MPSRNVRGKDPYHKGQLREKFLREAARTIAKEGVEGVSMRKLSDKLGVSRMAAYHHFADKDALLAAVGQDGFRRLTQRLQKAAASTPTAAAQLQAALSAYVQFALEETEFFRLMFSGALERHLEADRELRPFPFSSTEAITAFDLLVTAVRRCQSEASIAPGDALLTANYLHTFVHGVASLAIDGHLKLPCSLEEYLQRSLKALLSSLRSLPL